MSEDWHPTQGADVSDALAQAVWEQRCAMLFKAWVQVRYHRRRQRFFDLVDKASKAATLLFGALLFGRYLQFLPWLATGISALGLMALVFGYGDRKQQHKELAEQSARLVGEIEAVAAGRLTPDLTAGWAADYARLCAKAPPPLKTLTLLCEREQSSLDGYPEHVPSPPWWRRALADVKT